MNTDGNETTNPTTAPSQQPGTRCTAFDGPRLIASGELGQVAVEARKVFDRNPSASILIFDDGTSELIEVDFRGTADEVAGRLAGSPRRGPQPAAATAAGEPSDAEAGKDTPRGPGRPRLGVVAREVTLLPRHWEWLNSQPGGASVALRRLVEDARRANAGKDRVRQSQNATYRFMSAMAGDRPGFEEALRALFAANRERFAELTEPWPEDIRDHARRLAAIALRGASAAPEDAA